MATSARDKGTNQPCPKAMLRPGGGAKTTFQYHEARPPGRGPMRRPSERVKGPATYECSILLLVENNWAPASRPRDKSADKRGGGSECNAKDNSVPLTFLLLCWAFFFFFVFLKKACAVHDNLWEFAPGACVSVLVVRRARLIPDLYVPHASELFLIVLIWFTDDTLTVSKLHWV